ESERNAMNGKWMEKFEALAGILSPVLAAALGACQAQPESGSLPASPAPIATLPGPGAPRASAPSVIVPGPAAVDPDSEFDPVKHGSRAKEGSMSEVVINGVQLSAAEIDRLAHPSGARIPPGRYWYDPACGAWGIEGGPGLGLVAAGQSLGGKLRPEASGGGNGRLTGVFVNGRELHPTDVMALAQLGPVYPGRYWVDAAFNFGLEGYPQPLGNLAAAARARSSPTGPGYNKQTNG